MLRAFLLRCTQALVCRIDSTERRAYNGKAQKQEIAVKKDFNQAGRWKVVTENAFTSGCPERAAPELARQIEERIHSEGLAAQAKIVDILPRQGMVIVACDDEFGVRLNDLPGASYAEKAKPAAKKFGIKPN